MIIAALMCSLAPLQESGVAARWEHQLVVHESFEDFFGGGMASAYRAELNADAPVAITAGHVHGGKEPIDQAWDEQPETRAPEWLDGFYESAEIFVAGGFREVLPSWNVQCSPGSGMCFELRVRKSSQDSWSPWLYLGDWGDALPPPLYLRKADPGGPRVDFAGAKNLEIPGAKIETDYFTSGETWKRLQYRVRTHVANPERAQIVRLRRVALCFSRNVEGAAAPEPAFTPVARLAVPFRSQKSAPEELASRICSPTSVAMVLAFRGADVPTLEVAKRSFDAAHDIYGNWSRAVQGAYSYGVPGYVARFGSWSEVRERLAAGQPLVISIAAKPGELTGAPYPSTNGHLLVVSGLEAPDRVLVHDPAAADEAQGVTSYARAELERVWLARGGTAYVLLPKER